jgi:mycothiol synthase
VTEIRAATWDDFDGAFELLETRSRALFGIPELKRDHLRQSWSLPGFTVGLDNWVASDGSRIVGYAAIDSAQDLDYAANDPADGDGLLALAESRASERGFATLALTTVPADEPANVLAERSGFELDREILRMWRPLDGNLPEPVWPQDITVRSYTPNDAERVHAVLDESYAGWDTEYVLRPHADWLAFMTEHDEFDPAFWMLAERDGELVACALHWAPDQGHGWVKDIVVRAPERGNGLGKALLHHGFMAYAAAGATRVGLKVDSSNPTGARQLYERVGFVTDRRYRIWLKRL